MGIRPPPDDTLSEPDVIEFGIPALDARLDDVSFPVTARELRTDHGDIAVPYNAAGDTVSLREILDEIARSEFESEQELLNEAHPVFEQRRAEHPSGFLGQIRSFLPF